MVVCLCKGVSDKKIRWLVQNGATTLRDVMASCKAGSDCGTCICQVKELIESTRQAETAGDVDDAVG
jgi:bacterioferritin-associated ferredoxin